jgi:hypothetical protein
VRNIAWCQLFIGLAASPAGRVGAPHVQRDSLQTYFRLRHLGTEESTNVRTYRRHNGHERLP